MNEQRARVRVADQAHGLAVARLARAALDAAWDRDLKVTPLCPDIAGYMRRHPEYITLVDERHRADVSLELAPIRAGRGRQRARLFQRSCAQCMQSLVGSVLRAATCSDNFAVAPPRTLAGFCSRGITAPSREGSPGVFMWSSTVSESTVDPPRG